MKKFRTPIIIFNLVLLLGYANFSILQKEKTLKNGQLVLLELAPVDPRSLMQGDYMRLRYAIANDVRLSNLSKRGFCIVELDENNVAKNFILGTSTDTQSENEHPIAYTASNGRLRIGAESFFFQEGKREKYEKAKYGGLKVDKAGNSILVGLYDEDYVEIK